MKYSDTCYGSTPACRPRVTLRHIFTEATPSRKKLLSSAITRKHFYEQLDCLLAERKSFTGKHISRILIW